jgi:hypothetical protein
VPDWRGFQDFGFSAEVRGFGYCGPLAASRPADVEAEGLPAFPNPDGAGVTAEIFHSMKVEELFPALEGSFEGPGFGLS